MTRPRIPPTGGPAARTASLDAGTPGGSPSNPVHDGLLPRKTLRPRDRVKKRPRFLEVQHRGRKIHTAHFVVTVLGRAELPPTETNPWAAGDQSRLGITVTKKVAGAVGRNRVKRVVREVFRCNRPSFPRSSDVVVIAKDGASTLTLRQVEDELTDAMARLKSARGPRRP